MKANERIKQLRLSHHFTLKEIADRLDVSEATVQRYESGQIKTIPYDTIDFLADLYGVSPAYVMGWEPEYKKGDIKSIENLTQFDIEILNAYHNAPILTQDAALSVLGLKRK